MADNRRSVEEYEICGELLMWAREGISWIRKTKYHINKGRNIVLRSNYELKGESAGKLFF